MLVRVCAIFWFFFLFCYHGLSALRLYWISGSEGRIANCAQLWRIGERFSEVTDIFTGIIWINTIASTYNRWPYLRLISRRYTGDMTGYGSVRMETAFCLVLFSFSYVLLSSLWGFPLLHPSIFFHLSNSASWWWGWSLPGSHRVWGRKHSGQLVSLSQGQVLYQEFQ